MKLRYHKSISIISIMALTMGLLYQPVLAVTKDSLQKDAASNQKKLDAAEAEADDIESEKGLAEEELEAAQEQLVNLLASVAILESDIERKKEEIAQAEEEYEVAKKEEERQYNTMRARIKYMYENGTSSSTEYLDILLNAQSLTDALNKAAYAEKLAEYDRNMLNKYTDAKEAMKDKKRLWKTTFPSLRRSRPIWSRAEKIWMLLLRSSVRQLKISAQSLRQPKAKQRLIRKK